MTKPIKHRCSAITKKGTQCTRGVVKDTDTCSLHGGQHAKMARVSVAKALPKGRYRRISEDAQRRIDAAVQDPMLLDVRRPVALGQVIVEEAALIPDDDVLIASIRRKKMRAVATIEFTDLQGLDEWLEPTAAEVEVERIRYLDESMRLLERFAKRQADAAKNIEMGRLLNEQAVPMLAEMGTRVARLVERYVDADKRPAFIASFRQECVMLVQELTVLGDKHR